MTNVLISKVGDTRREILVEKECQVGNFKEISHNQTINSE